MADASKRIMVVEDAEDIRDSVAEILETEGYEVVSAAHGREALEKLRAAAELPGLILLDLMMPVMDGFQFRTEQQRDSRLALIPVLLMTAGGDVPLKAKELDVRGYLRKPFKDIDSMLETIRRSF
jgi:CheY-like chemotaxis protein